MDPIIGIIFVAALLFGIGLAIYHNKKDQRKIMNYYTKTSKEGFDVSAKSLENQERMIALLEDISKKLGK
jgi:hypothetical protein